MARSYLSDDYQTAKFDLHSSFQPDGDQPQAIEALLQGLQTNRKHQVLLGITGSGKTFTMANLIQRWQRPTLVIAHNKTLAAQLYKEFKAFFPNNSVEYFVSFYDYYQPEAYVANKDLYIEKDTAINDELERMRLSATRALMEREDVIIVASVSCIYGLGSPEEYGQMVIFLKIGDIIKRREILRRLVELKYDRNDTDFHRGTFRVRGDVIEIYLAEKDWAVRIELFGDEVEAISRFDPLTGKKQENLSKITVYPNTHYVSPPDHLPETLRLIRVELNQRLFELRKMDKLVEHQRLQQRTEHDLEMMAQTGYCTGIENYSRILQRREAGSPPPTLISYFPANALIFIDESHVTLPQVRGMSHGDHSRKSTLVEHGFRLPSAIDNRPLRFEEFEELPQQFIHVSATPSLYEIEKSQGLVVEQVIRPTGLLEPEIEVRPVDGQVDDMLEEIRLRAQACERVLITTLTKRMAEDLTEYYQDLGVKVRYMHSDIDAVERSKILFELRRGDYDVLVGINLLREGLDLPEVSLVGIFDADKEGFLRSVTSLIQTVGRAARNVNGKVIMYADRMTESMKNCIETTKVRRERQVQFNKQRNITPRTIFKPLHTSLVAEKPPEESLVAAEAETPYDSSQSLEDYIKQLKKEMMEAAQQMDFERAAQLRDQVKELEQTLISA